MGSIANLQAIEAVDKYVDSVDLGSGTASGHVLIYDGTVPTNVDTALGAQVLLADLPMSNPAFGAGADANPGGRATANAITDDTTANNTGTPTFCRVVDRNGLARLQMTVGTSGTEVIINAVPIQAGAIVSITAMTFTQPES